ncbi:MAG: hypothetical protein IJU40_04305, partial [Desulfovibrionaceae bacterium]|nr:hypothetical protein [Desulfovibrionaceae bacterium]
MDKIYLLGIDAGGTHTDAVIMEQKGSEVSLITEAKVVTDHNNLTHSMRE